MGKQVPSYPAGGNIPWLILSGRHVKNGHTLMTHSNPIRNPKEINRQTCKIQCTNNINVQE